MNTAEKRKKRKLWRWALDVMEPHVPETLKKVEELSAWLPFASTSDLPELTFIEFEHLKKAQSALEDAAKALNYAQDAIGALHDSLSPRRKKKGGEA